MATGESKNIKGSAISKGGDASKQAQKKDKDR